MENYLNEAIGIGEREWVTFHVIPYLESLGAYVVDLQNIGNNVPDLVVSYNGVTFYVECKVPKGTLSKGQKFEHKLIDNTGCTVYTVYSIKELQNKIEGVEK